MIVYLLPWIFLAGVVIGDHWQRSRDREAMRQVERYFAPMSTEMPTPTVTPSPEWIEPL